MLCRALLAAAALSCTLSIPRAQATGRLTQIKDLICVLVMSGMQKEDLEISMLRKLQRYDVNIDDLNNGKLRRDCPSTNKVITTEAFITTTELITTSTIADLLNGLNAAKILNYLKAQQKPILTQTTTEIYTFTEQDVTPTSVYLNPRPKIDLNLLQEYFQATTTYRPTNEDQKESTSRLNIDEYIYSNFLSGNEMDTKEAPFINKAFKDFLIQHRFTTTTTEKITTKRTNEINNIYEQISNLIKIKNNSNKVIERKNKKLNENRGYNNAGESIKNVISSDMNEDKNKVEKNNLEIKTIYDFITIINQFKTYLPLAWSQNDSTILPQYHDVKLENIFNNNAAPVSTRKPDKSILKIPDSQTELKTKSLSPILVKEIAENIKDVIIKDLRKELSSIYFKLNETISTLTPPLITTSAAPTRKPSETILQEKELSTMGTFIELYDRIKTMKQSFFVIPVNNRTDNFREDMKSQTIFPRIIPMINKFNDPQPKVSYLPIEEYKAKQFVRENPYLPRQKNKYQRPITIQTNSIEIKPLALPLSKPENLVRENIIISARQDSQSRDITHARHLPRTNSLPVVQNIHRNGDNMQNLMQQNYEFTHNSPFVPSYYTHHVPKHNRDDIRVTMTNNGNSRLDADYYERINFGAHNNGDIENTAMLRHHNIPRFHERLERLEDGGSAMLKRNIPNRFHRQKQENVEDVASRQQLSLIDMKKGKNYDDTHFKNFLNTQQKVTDILEKILASNSKNNMPRSVEFA